MALLPALLVVVLLESFAALTLAATTARIRQVADRRLAVEAGMALEQAVAAARLANDSLLAHWPPATRASLAPPAIPGWRVDVLVDREGTAPVVRLGVGVIRLGADGHPRAARHATLLLLTGAADTAIVLDNRPVF